MEEVSSNNSSGQVCPACGKTSPANSGFCQHCGQNFPAPAPANQSAAGNVNPTADFNAPASQPQNIVPPSPPVPLAQTATPGEEKKGSTGKKLLIIIGLLALLGAAAGGGYFAYTYKQQKDAKAYIEKASTDFGKTVEDINKLSTEKKLEDKDNNLDLYVKKLEEEKNNAEVALSDLKSGKENLSKVKTNKLVVSSDALLKQYYDDATEKVDAYNKLMAYEIQGSKEMSKFISQMDKMKAEVKTINNFDELKKTLTGLRDSIDGVNNSLKTMTPPAGLEEAHNKIIKFFEGFSISLTGVITAINENSQQKFDESARKLDEYMTDEKSFKEIEQLEDYFYEEQHKKFNNLREKADQIKTDFMGYKNSVKAEVKDMSIEGW